MASNSFTEAEVQALVGQRVKRNAVIGEVKGYEYIAHRGGEEEPDDGAYALLILWDGGTTEKVNKAVYQHEVEELE